MITSKTEILVALGKAGQSALSSDDNMLLEMVMPLAESSLTNYIDSDLQLGQFQRIEYLPIGAPVVDRGDGGMNNFGASDTLADYEKINGRVVFVGTAPGTEFLQLKYLPVQTTGIQVWEDLDAYANQAPAGPDGTKPFDDSSLLTLGVDYFAEEDQPGLSRSGILHRIGAWPREPRCVKVRYWGGMTDAQLNGSFGGSVKLSAIETIVQAFRQLKTYQKYSGPLAGESIGLYSYQLNGMATMQIAGMVVDIPLSAKMRLEKFRNWGRLFG